MRNFRDAISLEPLAGGVKRATMILLHNRRCISSLGATDPFCFLLYYFPPLSSASLSLQTLGSKTRITSFPSADRTNRRTGEDSERIRRGIRRGIRHGIRHGIRVRLCDVKPGEESDASSFMPSSSHSSAFEDPPSLIISSGNESKTSEKPASTVHRRARLLFARGNPTNPTIARDFALSEESEKNRKIPAR